MSTPKSKKSWYRKDKAADPIKYRLKNFFRLFSRRGHPLSEEDQEVLEKRVKGTVEVGVECRYCKEYLTVKTVSCDHGVPLSRGGADDLTNIDLICLSCNMMKGSLTREEFTKLMAFLETEPDIAKILRTRLKMSGIVYTKGR